MELTIEEKKAYSYVIAANNKYFDIVKRIIDAKRNGIGCEELYNEMQTVHKDASIAALMVDESLKTIKSQKRRMIFKQLMNDIDEEFHQDIDRVQYKDIDELVVGDGTIEEILQRFEDRIEEL